MTPQQAVEIANKPYIRWVGAYEPADKLAPDLTPGRVRIWVTEPDVVEQGALINRIEQIGGTVQLASASQAVIEATLDSVQLNAIAAGGVRARGGRTQ